MNQKSAPSSIALVVDGYSTGQFYPTALREKGLRPVHVSSGTEKHSPGLESYVSEALDHMRHDYETLFHGWSNMDDLVASLAAMVPCCVMAGCEMGVEMADQLALRLGLPGNDAATSHIRRDKLAMHDTLAQVGLPSLASLATDSLDEALAFAADLDSWPVVVKPLRSAATEGVRFCRSAEELRDAFHWLLGSFSQFGERNAQVLIQQYAKGREYAVNTVSRDGRHILSDLWVYEKIQTPGGAPLYDRTQLVRTLNTDHRAIVDYAFQVLDALGIRIGPAHTEIMLTDRGPVLIECGARPMGGAFPQDLIRESLGHTQVQWAVDSYADAGTFDSNARQPYLPTHSICVKSLISTQEGAIQAIPGIALATRLPSVRYGNFIGALSNGQVARTVDLLTNSAHVFLCHQDQAVVDADWAILRELEIEAQNLLFEMSPTEASLEIQDDWFAHVPDECWLKPEAESYRDADFIWQALGLSAGERVLDCPCGDSRVGVHLAQRGAIVTGLDLNPKFIARAGERFAAAGISAQLRVGDMRELDDKNTYDVIVNWFNSFGYFGIEDDFQVLLRFAEALCPGGRLLMEAPNRAGLLDNLVRRHEAESRQSTVAWDEVTERLITHLTVTGPDGVREVKSGARMYSLAQYKLLIQLAGLRLDQVYGEELTPFRETSRRMIMVAVKPGP
jgi:biotin carboxylase